ncbi:MAG TPA: hypothetical protein VFY23_01145 [Candidatus Limnocylindrales bacterium]|nr:hypothetical protein [Candidatus Limnocylindrales bacterium]
MTVTRADEGRARSAAMVRRLLSTGALAVFAVTWVYIAAAVLTDGALLADTWAWLTGLGAIATVLAWLALLPLAVFLWAWQANLDPLAMALVVAGLVGWTMLAISGLRRR